MSALDDLPRYDPTADEIAMLREKLADLEKEKAELISAACDLEADFADLERKLEVAKNELKLANGANNLICGEYLTMQKEAEARGAREMAEFIYGYTYNLKGAELSEHVESKMQLWRESKEERKA